MPACKLLTVSCLSFALANKYHGAVQSPLQLFLVQAQSTSAQRGSHRSSSSSSRRPPLHNKNHESTVRNIIQPRFKPNSNQLTPGKHTSNVAIIVSSSRYWFNYRHVTNALSIYHLLKRGGITDDNIILMLADDIPCNMRNAYRGKIFPRGVNGGDLMEDVEIDYSGTDVTVDAFLRVLLGRHLPGEEGGNIRSWPKLDENTNVMVYLTGHGGDNFFKFQDGEELMSNDIASVFSQMYELKRYNEILFISDTCQAFTMADEIKVPNVFSVGSSLKDQNSYASHSDTDVGQSVIDRYSKIIKDFVDDAVTLTSSDSTSQNNDHDMDPPFDDATIAVMERFNLHDALVRIPMNHGELGPNSHVGHADHLCSRRMNKIPMSDFFAATSEVRESQTPRNVKSSLWMSDLHIAADSEGLREANNDLEEECVADGEPNEQSHRGEQRKAQTKVQQKGMSPFDTKFLSLAACFLFCVMFTSRVW